MADAANTTTKTPPRGGRKGGTIYPHLNLQKALEYAKKLVSKTHTGPQPEDDILPGVFGNSGPDGKVRASALKQFGLMEGNAKAYLATKLAKDIEAALPDGRAGLLRQAFLNSKVFDKVFDTYHGDTVSKAQIAKRAKELEVHPDSADECAQLFIDSALTSELGSMNGESIRLVNISSVTTADSSKDNQAEDPDVERLPAVPTAAVPASPGSGYEKPVVGARSAKAALTVTLNVDPSSDPDKLEKQLKLLREYGVI
jgi:hypothetical protein